MSIYKYLCTGSGSFHMSWDTPPRKAPRPLVPLQKGNPGENDHTGKHIPHFQVLKSSCAYRVSPGTLLMPMSKKQRGRCAFTPITLQAQNTTNTITATHLCSDSTHHQNLA